jgi:hypothetical protein
VATLTELNVDSEKLRNRIERFQSVRDNILAQVRHVKQSDGTLVALPPMRQSKARLKSCPHTDPLPYSICSHLL